jgi:histidine triad (HIT) family protein
MTPECIFCRIAANELPSTLLYEDEHGIVFSDLHPKAPTHWLIVPRRHIERLSDLTDAERPLIGHLLLVVNRMARQAGIDEAGYRVVINCGPAGGQTVSHLHLHLLGGRAMHWPPG